ncbi:MAG: hypothetical protein H6627_12695 [Calditrichae bacterium]|nr:hypothetical protein [Calditrichia bacterium]
MLLAELTTPFKIQEFLDTVPYSPEPVYRCPLQVLRDRLAHCFDGALFAAAALRRMGYPPLILEMLPNERDDDHLLALFKIDGHWGAIAKSNFAGLRFREPVFRNLRELVLSYFEQYYNVDGEKTLRGYTVPMNLSPLDHLNWMTSDTGLDELADRTDLLRRYWLLSEKMISRLSPVDERTYKTGLDGANQAGLFKIKD